MNGNNFLLDTNTILYLLNGNKCVTPYLKGHFYYSIITEMELLSFSELTDTDENNIKLLLSICENINITVEIKNLTILLRKKYKIKLPDAIIAATAISNNLVLITADKGFSKIEELDLILLTPS